MLLAYTSYIHTTLFSTASVQKKKKIVVFLLVQTQKAIEYITQYIPKIISKGIRTVSKSGSLKRVRFGGQLPAAPYAAASEGVVIIHWRC